MPHPVFPVILPPCFYRPRQTRFGFEIRDVMPWSDAVTYATDGVRFGVQFRDGREEWLIQPGDDRLLAGRYHIAVEKLPADIHVDLSARDVVQAIWRENASLLNALGSPVQRAAS